MEEIVDGNLDNSEMSLLTKILIFLIIMSTIIIIGIFIFYFLQAKSVKENLEDFNNISFNEGLEDRVPDIFNIPNISIEENLSRDDELENLSRDDELIVCLRQEVMDIECVNIFLRKNIIELCHSIDELNNDCFYNAAIVNRDSNYCDKIESNTLKDDCKFTIMVDEEIFEEFN